MARDCPDAGPMACRRCRKEGHIAKDCDVPTICGGCGENHHVSECPTTPKGCHLCNEEGHMARDCPNRACGNCKEKGMEPTPLSPFLSRI